MRVRFQSLKGMEVLADKEGRLLGSVKRLQIDSKRKAALGLVFKARGISGEQWTKVSGISRVGEDVIFLPDSKAVRDDEPSGRDVRDMLGLSVTSLDGKRLGALQDVILDTDKWTVAALALDNGGEVDLGPQTVFGEDTILLQKGAADQVRQTSDKQSGFLSRVFSSDEESPAKAKKPAKRKRKTRRK
jgi:sporulation protein YlmC with PRC-barrel domain